MNLTGIEFSSAQVSLFLISDDRGREGHSLMFVDMQSNLDQKLNISLKRADGGSKTTGGGGKGGGDADSQRSHFHFPDIGSTVNCMTDVLLVECKKVATF